MPLPRPQAPQPPYIRAFLLCDAVEIDKDGKRSIRGIVNGYVAKAFPTVVPKLSVFLVFSDGRGDVPFRIRLTAVDDEVDPLFDQQTVIKCDDPHLPYELVIGLENLEFPAPGEYRFQVFGCNVHLMEHRLVIVDAE
jgi:hypothetical protein